MYEGIYVYVSLFSQRFIIYIYIYTQTDRGWLSSELLPPALAHDTQQREIHTERDMLKKGSIQNDSAHACTATHTHTRTPTPTPCTHLNFTSPKIPLLWTSGNIPRNVALGGGAWEKEEGCGGSGVGKGGGEGAVGVRDGSEWIVVLWSVG